MILYLNIVEEPISSKLELKVADIICCMPMLIIFFVTRKYQ